ncbi:hypothetical protein LCGC14_0490870 [marine sediment metagenome]|uniref:Uncharacterized protein n=1 Tax=marine sediment metagenome TaxID=412755 RepID=A0A0F9SBP6_9ZZZZ
MYDTNLMLLDNAALVTSGGEVTGAYLDLWEVNADIGPQFDAYEDATPGTGQVVRPLIWNFTIHSVGTDVSGIVDMRLQFSEDGTGAEEVEHRFPVVVNADPPVVVRQSISVLAPYRYVRYSFGQSTINGSDNMVASLGPTDGGEYASPGT